MRPWIGASGGGGLAFAAAPGYRLRVAAASRRTLALVGMWVAALLALGALAYGRYRLGSPVRSAEDAPVHRAAEEKGTGAGNEREEVARPDPQGPPRMFRGDPRHTGRSDVAGPESPALAWEHATEGRVTAQAAMDEAGRLYVTSHDGRLHALDSDGRVRFQHDLGARIWGTPYVDPKGRVYVGSDAGVLVALDEGGELAWRLSTGAPIDTGVVPGPEATLHFASGTDLYAVGSEDGRVRWRFRAREKIFTTPAVDADGTVFVGSQDDRLYAVTPEGKLRWSHATEDDVDSSPAIAEDGSVLFGSDDGHVRCVGPDGALRWSTSVGGYVRAPVALGADGSVVAAVYGPRPRIVALDHGSGAVRWSFELTRADSPEVGVRSGPLVDRDGRVYVGAHDDHLYALTPDGALRWVWAAKGDIHASPVLGPAGRLFVGSDDHRFYALRSAE